MSIETVINDDSINLESILIIANILERIWASNNNGFVSRIPWKPITYIAYTTSATSEIRTSTQDKDGGYDYEWKCCICFRNFSKDVKRKNDDAQ